MIITLFSDEEGTPCEVGQVPIPEDPIPQVIVHEERTFSLGTDDRYWEVSCYFVPGPTAPAVVIKHFDRVDFTELEPNDK